MPLIHELFVIPGTSHIDLYDKTELVNPAVEKLVDSLSLLTYNLIRIKIPKQIALGGGRLQSKIVLITEASSGMGEATAIRLKKAGYIVYAAAFGSINATKAILPHFRSMPGRKTAEVGTHFVFLKATGRAFLH